MDGTLRAGPGANARARVAGNDPARTDPAGPPPDTPPTAVLQIHIKAP
jgi:hypothetical protein